MKISVIGPTHPFKGGISHFTSIFVNELRREHEVNFISWKRQYPSFLYPVEQRDSVSKTHIRSETKFILDFFNPLSWVVASLSISLKKPKKIYVTWVTPVQAPIYIVITLIAKLIYSKSEIVVICHNSLPHERKFYDIPLTKLFFKLADDIIVHSSADANKISKICSTTIIRSFHPIYDTFNENKTYNLPNIKRDLKLKKNVILFFGYIRAYKGLNYLVNALPEVLAVYPDTTLLIVGEFWAHDKSLYMAQIKKLGLENNVVLIDRYVPNEDISMYFNLSNITVCPYISATQSGIVQMSYAFKKPVIASNVGGLHEVITDGQTGFLTKPADSSSLAEAIIKYFNNPFIINTRILKEFSWATYIKNALKNQKVLGLISYDYDPPIGGQGTYVRDIVKYLDGENESGINTVIVSSARNNSINHIHLPRVGGSKLSPIIFSLFTNIRINKIVKTRRIRLLHVQIGAGGVFILRKPQVPIIVTSHMLYSKKLELGYNPLYKILFQLERRTMIVADSVIVTSDLMKQEVVEKYFVDVRKIKVIYPAVNINVDYSKNIKKKYDNYLFVGRLEKTKRILELVELFISMHAIMPTINLTIVGEGSLKKRIIELINSKHAQKYIIVKPFAKSNTLSKYYASSSALILPSLYEPLGIVAVESLLHGTPVIISSTSGLYALIKNNNWGEVINSIEEIKNIIENFDREKYVIDTQQVKNIFNQKKINAQLKESYETLF